MKCLRAARVASSKWLEDAAVQCDFAKISTVDRAVLNILVKNTMLMWLF